MSAIKGIEVAGAWIELTERADDLQAACELFRNEFDVPLGDPMTLRKLIIADIAALAVAKVGDRVIGANWGAFGRDRHGPFGYGMGFAVSDEYRSGGIGSALTMYLMQHAHGRGAQCFRWLSDPLHLQRSRLYLGKLGAVVTRYVSDCFEGLLPLESDCNGRRVPGDRFEFELAFDGRGYNEGGEELLVALPGSKKALRRESVDYQQLAANLDPLLEEGAVVAEIQECEEGWAYRVRRPAA